MPAGGDDLIEVLREARARGFLGPDEPERHVEHATAFIAAVEHDVGPAGPSTFLDLGTGAGVPGLVLLLRWPGAHGVLVDASHRRGEFARGAAATLGLADRCSIVVERAEVLGRDPVYREQAEVVVARSFGPPSVTAELASPLVAVTGLVVVSEPPEPDPGRWPPDHLAGLGLGPARIMRSNGAGAAVLTKLAPAPERYPRRVGVPAKRPLW